MSMFSRVAIAAVTMVGVASAQPSKAPAPAPAPKAAQAPAPADKGAAMPKLTPPPELDAVAKASVGTWKCKGEEWDHTGAKAPMTATSKVKLDLDNWWVSESMEAKGRMTFKMTSFSTYDATSRKWRRVAVTNGGGQMIGTSDGMKDGKMTWNMDMIGPMGSAQFRDTTDATDPKAGVKFRGEASMDKGKTWMPVYEMVCKK